MPYRIGLEKYIEVACDTAQEVVDLIREFGIIPIFANPKKPVLDSEDPKKKELPAPRVTPQPPEKKSLQHGRESKFDLPYVETAITASPPGSPSNIKPLAQGIIPKQTCEICQKEFQPFSRRSRFCSKKCMHYFHNHKHQPGKIEQKRGVTVLPTATRDEQLARMKPQREFRYDGDVNLSGTRLG
jgi:hypothetical protein